MAGYLNILKRTMNTASTMNTPTIHVDLKSEFCFYTDNGSANTKKYFHFPNECTFANK